VAELERAVRAKSDELEVAAQLHQAQAPPDIPCCWSTGIGRPWGSAKSVAELERAVRAKSDELEVAAQLGQALVRKETKLARALEVARARVAELEAAELQANEAESARLGEQLTLQEKLNSKLEYDLRRKDLQIEHLEATR
jgi:hypothetical protein